MNPKNLQNTFERYGLDFQNSLIKSLLIDNKFFEEIYEIITHDLFMSEPHRYLVKKIKEYYETYKAIPEIEHISAIARQEKDPKLIEEVSLILEKIKATSSNLNFIKEESLKFCLNQKVRNAIEESIQLLPEENYDKIKKIILEATQFGKRDLGHDYERDVMRRLVNSRMPITTGFSLLDAVFDGGVGGGELAVICGGPSIGKSFFLVNLAKRAMDSGKKVIYYTLELAETLIGKRFDALITGIPINDLEKRKEQVLELIPKYLSKTGGSLKIKQYPTKKATVNTFIHHLDLLRRNFAWEADMIFIDYGDIVKPLNKGENKKRFELESVYEEMRGFAVEQNKPVWTASQANKEGTYGDYVTLANMSESFAKAAIADIVLGITRTHEGALNNKGTCYIAKNRGFGRDGLILPVEYQTAVAKINIPSTPELLEKVQKGTTQNLAKFYFEEQAFRSNPELDDLLGDVDINN